MRHRTAVLTRITAAFAIAGGLLSVVSTPAPAAAQPTLTAAKGQILIGFTTNYAGSLGAVFGGIQNGFQTYIDHINATGGVNGQKIKIITLNDQGDPASASVNFSQLVADGAKMVVANTGSTSYSALTPLAVRDKIPLFGTNVLTTDVQPFVYGYSSPLPNSMLAELTFAQKYLLNGKKHVRVAWVNNATAVVPGIQAELNTKLPSLGWSLVDTEVMPFTATTFTVQAGKIAAAKPDLIIDDEANTTDPTIDKALRAAGTSAPIVETYGGYSPATIALLDDPNFYVFYNYIAPSTTSNPGVKVMLQQAKQAGRTLPDLGTATGLYLLAKSVVAALKQCGATCTPVQLNRALQTRVTAVNTDGLSPGVGFTSKSHTLAKSGQFIHASNGQIVNVGKPVQISG